MSLRAIAAAAVVLCVIAAPGFRRRPPRRPAAGPPTAVMVSGPDVGHRAPTFRFPGPTRTAWARRTSRTTWRCDRGKTVVARILSRATSPAGAPPRCGPSPSSMTRCSGPTSWSWASAPIRWRPTRGSRRASNLPFRLLSDPQQQVARKYAANDRSGYMRRVVYVVGPDGKVHTATSASTRWTRSTIRTGRRGPPVAGRLTRPLPVSRSPPMRLFARLGPAAAARLVAAAPLGARVPWSEARAGASRG